ncbi:MAG: hypothetical protein INR65_08735 [Gluconacetobacter diazotrophicus]|nr:hypothetical protein [Gluconacetobacter diazotrophicus]
MPPSPDPHGQAALMLCEALALLLIEEGTIPRERMVEAIDGVIEVKQELARTSEKPEIGSAAISLLQDIVRSVALASPPGPSPGR